MENNTQQSPMKGNQKTLWIIVTVLAIILIAVFVFKNDSFNRGSEVEDTLTTEVEPTEDLSEGSITAGTVTSGTQATSLSYQKALELYKDKRIQFDSDCQAFPNTVTYKNGTTIMIDNRSPQTATIKLPTTVTVKGYGFKIVKLSSSTVPKTILVDCGASQNVATILLQR